MWNKRLTPSTNIMDYGLFQLHQKRNKHKPSFRYESRLEMLRVVRALFKEIARSILTSEDGVVAKGLGYFAIWKTPVKRIKKNTLPDPKALNYNFHTNGYIYNPSLFTDVFTNSKLKGWSMDRSFTEDFNHNLSVQLRKGKKYKFRHTLVKSMFNTTVRRDNQVN